MAKKAPPQRKPAPRGPPPKKGKGKAPKGRKQPMWMRIARKLIGKRVDEKVNETADRYVVANPLYAFDEVEGREIKVGLIVCSKSL